MPSTAFFFEITFASLLVVSISAVSSHCVSCRCGSTSQNYTQCIDESLLKDLSCERWSHCETCKANTTFCITCPPARFGPTCSEISQGHTRRKRQDDADLLNHPNYPRQSGSCPFLEGPESGSIRCSHTGNVRYCTSRCLPGHHFEGHENEDKMTLRCQRGVWKPQNFFPRCISGGFCEVQVTGAGFYNCTTDMNGTHCDITCDGWYRGRFHCFPGADWYPPLPFCTIPKEPIPCRCENGGICDESGKCMCPEGRTGTYCENLEREKATCDDPGIPRDASRLNPDGSDASYPRVFEEGESVIFTCNRENAALQGKSYLTCLPDGTWSEPLPRCITSRTIGPTVYCPDPGYIQFGSRVNADSSSSRPSSRYRSGQSVVYYCHEGYGLVGNSKLTCMSSGQWSSKKPFCRKFDILVNRPTERPSQTLCRHPGVDVNGIIEDHPLLDPQTRGQTFPPGTELTFDCKEGFEPEGAVILSCMRSGEWSSAPPTCKRITTTTTVRCPLPVVNPNVDVDEFFDLDERKLQSFEPGDKLTFSCREGDALRGPSEIECLGNGRWSSTPPTCNPQPPVLDAPSVQLCPRPEVDPNGQVEEWFLDPRKIRQSFEPGTELTFSCKEGYVLQGWATIRCNSNGQWSNSSPKCNVRPDSVRCKNPGHISNGRVDVFPPFDATTQPSAGDNDFDFPLGTHLKFTCEDGYRLVGKEDSMTCEISGYWSGSPPMCERNA